MMERLPCSWPGEALRVIRPREGADFIYAPKQELFVTDVDTRAAGLTTRTQVSSSVQRSGQTALPITKISVTGRTEAINVAVKRGLVHMDPAPVA
jgi:hypothetical protein